MKNKNVKHPVTNESPTEFTAWMFGIPYFFAIFKKTKRGLAVPIKFEDQQMERWTKWI